MLDLDNKVNRDSIYFALENQHLGGWFKKLKSKVKKVTRKIGKVITPKKIYKELSRFESKHRKELKIIGAVGAIAVGGYYYGPKMLAMVKGLGGKKLAVTAAKASTKLMVSKTIKDKLTKKQDEQMKKAAQTMTPEQFIVDPVVAKITQDIVADMAVKKVIPPTIIKPSIELVKVAKAKAILAKEGAIEIEHQIEKVAQPRIPEWVKFGAPVVGLLAFIL